MSIIGDVLNDLAQTDVPALAAEVFPDLLDVLAETKSLDSYGAEKQTAEAAVYQNVPVQIEKRGEFSEQDAAGGKRRVFTKYVLTFPVVDANGERLTVTKNHRLKVLARGLEPVRYFLIVSPVNQNGIVYEAECKEQ